MKKTHENILLYKILHKTLTDANPLRFRFDKIGWFIRVYDGTRCLVLFGGEKYDFICNRIRYVVGVKSGVTMLYLITMQKSKLIHTISCL